jgi:hypothetical protein
MNHEPSKRQQSKQHQNWCETAKWLSTTWPQRGQSQSSGLRPIAGSQATSKQTTWLELDRQPNVGPEPALNISKNFYRTALEDWVRSAHSRDFTQYEGAAQAKQMLGGLDGRRAKEVLKWTRNDLRTYTEAVTGHAPLNRHLALMHLVDDPTCPECGKAEDTSLHLITECEAFDELRTRILGSPSITAQAVTGIMPRKLLKFVKATERLY